VRFSAGDRVTVRGGRWLVEDVTSFGDVTLLNLARADTSDSRLRCSVLLPFDRPVIHSCAPTIRAVSGRRWIHHLRSRLSDYRVFGQLRAASRASIDILPFQLAPALALIRGHSSRFLLADEVGLGKTIQAGLIVAELQQRGWCDHALILTPSGLRTQWADELLQRFDICASVVDAASLSTLGASLPFDVNPWAVDTVVVTSIDFVKQPEVLTAVSAQLWDILVVDEAHQASIGSLRYAAVKALAGRARHVVLLSATPHTGDDAAYRALCALGEIDGTDPILLFRRTREQAGLPRLRRAHLLPVAQTAHAMELHRLLDEYVGRLWRIAQVTGKRDVQLVAMILAKRAFSSAWSLRASLERRLAGLDEHRPELMQCRLPLADENPDDEASMPTVGAFDRVEEERGVLQALVEAARRAQNDEPKMCALKRLLRRLREPVIVFTEYRDTLDAIALAVGTLRKIAFLHGGQTPQERRDSIRAFVSGAADVLLATDAGSEGLNLQDNCRVVVSLELPWNPMRLEQRIGRVDRIGQRRTVHAINLLAANTAESTVLATLLRRLDRIRLSEIEIAACVICRSEPSASPKPEQASAHSIELEIAAQTEAARISNARAAYLSRSTLPNGVVPATTLRLSRKNGPENDVRCPAPSLIVFCRTRLVNRAGRLVEDTLIPVLVPLARLAAANKRRDVRALVEQSIGNYQSLLIFHARAGAEKRARAIEIASAGTAARVVRRESHITQWIGATHSGLIQDGLFDNRAAKKRREAQRRDNSILHDSAKHLESLQAEHSIALARDPEIELALLIC
jgi:superfamily II DNA or RNA helicase